MIFEFDKLKRDIEQDKNNFNLRLCLVSLFIINNKLDKALDELKNILLISPSCIQAKVMLCFFSRLKEKKEDYSIDDNYKQILIHADEIIKKNVSESPEKSDLGIVLGHKLDKNKEIKELLKIRLLNAIKYLNFNYSSKIIVSGGGGEAEKMQEFLIKNNIEENRIICENNSKDSFENALFCFNLMQELNPKSLTVISDSTQIKRALVIFNQFNFQNKTCIKISGFTDKNPKLSQFDKMTIYRDLLRVIGFYLFPPF